MKSLHLFSLTALLAFICSVAPFPGDSPIPGPGDTDGYYLAMKSNVAKLDGSISQGELANVLANFERIATTEKSEWLPYYYVAFSNASMAYLEADVDQIDVWCDRALAALKTAKDLDPDLSELKVLEAFIAYARIRVDFMGRGFSYSREAMRSLAEALQHNPDNPRAYCLMGQHYLNVPPQLGGSKEKGCEYNERAVSIFQQERTDNAGEPYRIEPHWGYGDAVEVRDRVCGAPIDKSEE